MGANTAVITDANWESEIGKYADFALVDFWAEWCGPCKMLAPALEQVAADFAGKLKVGKLDIDDNSEAAQRCAIRSIPCLILFKGGQEVDRVVGLRNKAQLAEWLNEKMKG